MVALGEFAAANAALAGDVGVLCGVVRGRVEGRRAELERYHDLASSFCTFSLLVEEVMIT